MTANNAKVTKIDPEENVYEQLELLNAILIGLLLGTYDVLGKGGNQAVVNMAGKTVSVEILHFARDKGEPIKSLEDFRKFITKYNLAGNIDFYRTPQKTYARNSECKTCPKRWVITNLMVPLAPGEGFFRGR